MPIPLAFDIPNDLDQMQVVLAGGGGGGGGGGSNGSPTGAHGPVVEVADLDKVPPLLETHWN